MGERGFAYPRRMSPSLAAGQRVVVSELGETPMDAIEKYMALAPMEAPDVATLGPRDVLVEVKSASVGWVDLIMTSGQYQHLPKPPSTPGLEYAGVVAWAGPEASGGSVGDRVLVDGLLAGPRSLGAYRAYGGFASWGVAPVEAVRRIPGKLTFDQACNLLGNYETAYHCLVARGRVKAGETVLIHGASGSTGLAAVHVAKLLGATVIATGRSPEKLAVVKAQGADHVVDSKGEEGQGTRRFRDEVKALTGGKGVDVVYDGVGGDISVESLRCVRFGARFLIVGWAATPFVAQQGSARRAQRQPAARQPHHDEGLDVLGCPTVLSTVEIPRFARRGLAQVEQWAERGRSPHVSHIPLTDFKHAMLAMARGDVIGGCVLHP